MTTSASLSHLSSCLASTTLLRPSSLLVQGSQDIFLNLLRGRGARPSLLDVSISSDQELLKVPLDPLQTQKARLLRLHPLPHGLGVVSVDIGLAQDGEGDAVVELTEALNLVVAARVLTTELVAGETDDLEVVVLWLQFCGGCVRQRVADGPVGWGMHEGSSGDPPTSQVYNVW